MTATVVVEGLDALTRRTKDSPNVMKAALKIAARRAGQTGRKRMRERAAVLGHAPYDARLPNAIKFEVLGNAAGVVIAPINKSARSIEEGRKVGARVPMKLLIPYVRREGAFTGAQASVKTHKTLRKKSQTRAIRDAAWKLRMAIQQRGTIPLPFVRPTAKDIQLDVQRYYQEACEYVLKKMAGK